MAGDEFDPYALLEALERQRVTYIVVGALGRVIHGSDELTDGLDIVPSTREENLRRLGLALEELNARHPDGKAPALERDLAGEPLLELETDAGELKIVPEPAGTRGYDDLRRRARHSRSGAACAPRSPRSTTTPACWPRSAASRTASRCGRCSACSSSTAASAAGSSSE